MKTVKGKIRAYLSEYRSLDDVMRADGDELIDNVAYSVHDLTTNGYTVVGEADVVLTILDDDQILSNKIASLTKQKQSVIAEAQAKATMIDGQIQSLLAISYVPEQV